MQPLHISFAQHPFKVGAIQQNTQKIIQLAEEAKAAGSHMLVLPELALVGYPPEDLLLRPSLKVRIDEALAQLKTVKDIALLVGYPEVAEDGLYNSLAIIADGNIIGHYRKQHLPNYGVFDERRYFKPSSNQTIFNYKGYRVGLLICEDVWHLQPVQDLKKANADLVLVINASPFETGKHLIRRDLLSARARQSQLPIGYVNLAGAQDDLVFDGGTILTNGNGEIIFDGPRFEPFLLHAPFNKEHQFGAAQPQLQLSPIAETYQALVTAVKDYVDNSGFKGVLLGLSGGIDSALTLAIAVDALGADRVHAVMMPYTYTAQMSVEDARAQAERMGTSFHIVEINDVVQSYQTTLAPLFGDTPQDATEENLQARTRGNILMALSNKFGHLVLTTGNKSEMAVGYATLYGDMSGGYAPLKDVYKTQVFELARFRNQLEDTPVIPERVITRPPSAELRPDQKDQDSLPPYDVLDAILYGYIEQDKSASQLIKDGFDAEMVKQVLRMVDRNEYKRRQAAPGPRVSRRAFGRERRYPLVNGWHIGE